MLRHVRGPDFLSAVPEGVAVPATAGVPEGVAVPGSAGIGTLNNKWWA
jgi:hypothetical protein